MIDTGSEPGAWADAMRFPPFVADERDGTCLRNLPSRFEQSFDAGEGGGDTVTPAFAPVVPCLHAEPIATSKRDNPHGR